MSLNIISTDIDGVTIELQPVIGAPDAGVLHMLPGGTANPEGFDGKVLDIYAFTAVGFGNSRGGHYHLKLNEFFFTVSGTALWILSDFRDGSATKGKTIGFIVGPKPAPDAHGLPSYILAENAFPRIRVPAGIYHAIFPLTDERILSIGIGSTGYDKDDYRYPKLEEIPGALEILKPFGLPTSASVHTQNATRS